MKLHELIDNADFHAGKKYLQTSGHSHPGFDWIKQWRFRRTGGNPIKALPGMKSKINTYFEYRIAIDDGAFHEWRDGHFEWNEIKNDYQLVDP